MVGRPPLIAVNDGRTHELVRRETIADLLARDRGYNERPQLAHGAPASTAGAKRCYTASEWS